MSRLQARVEKLESLIRADENIALETTPEEEQAWQDWEMENMSMDFNAMLEEIKNRPPDLEYEKLTTAHEQAEYLRQKFDACLNSQRDWKATDSAHLQRREAFIRNFRATRSYKK